MSDWVTEEQIDFYQENGFVQIDNVLSSNEIEELREYIEEAMTEQGSNAVQNNEGNALYYRVLNQKVNTWRDHLGMAKYVAHPRITELARLLTRSRGMRLFHDHALWKMPGDSKPTPWHQDLPYWPMDKDSAAVSVWIALDDVDENNGCMMFVPKSHKISTFKNISLVEPEDIFQFAKGSSIDQERPVICRLKAGSCTFHSGRTFHYAHANNTQKPRRVLAAIYMPDGTIFNGKSHVVTDGTYLQAGEKFHGGLFPLLAR